jgi:hypothetical protein
MNKAILKTPIFLNIRGVDVVDGGTLFEAGMSIDAGGAPHAYHPDGKSGLDDLRNAGGPGNWYGVVTDNGQPDGNPVVQTSTDPAPGFYVSYTSLQDSNKKKNNPLRYVDSETIPYIVVPPQLLTGMAGVKLGDFATVLNTKNQKLQHAIVADLGPRNRIGEGSIALAKAIGVPLGAQAGVVEALAARVLGDSSSVLKDALKDWSEKQTDPAIKSALAGIEVKDTDTREEVQARVVKALSGTHSVTNGGADDGIIYKIFPGSAKGWPKTLDDINSEGERLLKAWGGQQRLLSELAGRSDLSQAK